MHGVAQWASVVCFSTIAVGMLELIAPNGKMEKIVRFVLAGFLIFSFVSPLKNLLRDVKFSHNTSNNIGLTQKDLQKQASQGQKQLLINSTEDMLKDYLKKKNILYRKIEINVNTKEDNCIDITKIKIHINDSHKGMIKEIENLVQKDLGFKVEVMCGQSEN